MWTKAQSHYKRSALVSCCGVFQETWLQNHIEVSSQLQARFRSKLVDTKEPGFAYQIQPFSIHFLIPFGQSRRGAWTSTQERAVSQTRLRHTSNPEGGQSSFLVKAKQVCTQYWPLFAR